MGTGINNIVRSVAPKSIFEDASKVVTTQTWAQGDLLVFDDTNNVIKKAAAEAEGSTFLGVAVVSISSGKLIGAYPGLTDVDAAMSAGAIPGPKYGVIAKLTLKTGDSINPGDRVYLDPATGGDGITVTGTKEIGVYQGGALTSVAAGTKVEVLLGARFPLDVLKF